MDELARVFHDAWRAVKSTSEPRAKTGAYLNDPNPTADLPDGWIWVRKDDDVPFAARNINVRTDRSDIDVILQLLDDDSYQVLQADPIRAPEALGPAAADINQPDSHGEMLGFAVPNRLLKDLRLRLAKPEEGGALTVVLEAGIYEDVTGTLVYATLQSLDLTSALPSSGTKVPVVLGLDSSAALVAYSGTEVPIPIPGQPVTTPYFTLSVFYDLRNAATGADLWLWALALYDGMTGFQSTDDFIDLRPYLSLGGGGSGAPTTAKYITQTPDAGLSAEQALSALATGIVKNTTTTGVLSIATDGTDYYSPTTLPEAVQDIIGAALVAGTNITITYNDPAGTITIAAGATPGGGAPPSICEGRLTLTSGTPVTISDVTAATTLYWTPHKGGYIGVYSGSAWVLFAPGELSISLAGLNIHTPYDVFMNYNSGTPALELTAWNAPTSYTITGVTNANPPVVTIGTHTLAVGDIVTSFGVVGSTGINATLRVSAITATTVTLQTLGGANPGAPGAYTSGGTMVKKYSAVTRATALTKQDGILVKAGATTRRYLGTIVITNTAGQTEDSVLRRLVWNYYNRAPRSMAVRESAGSWTYATSAWRACNNNLANAVEVVVGVQEDVCNANALSVPNLVSNLDSAIGGIGMDSFTAVAAQLYGMVTIGASAAGTTQMESASQYVDYLTAGYHFLSWIEFRLAGTITFNGYSVNSRAPGLVGTTTA